MTEQHGICNNCSAPLNGDRCSYCGTFYNKVSVAAPSEGNYDANADIDEEEIPAKAAPIDPAVMAQYQDQYRESPVLSFLKQLPWGILAFVLYWIFSSFVDGILGLNPDNILVSDPLSVTGFIRSALIILFMPAWAALITIEKNKKLDQDS